MRTIACKCGKTYPFDERLAGRRVRCRHCGQVIAVYQQPVAATVATPPAPAAAHPTPPQTDAAHSTPHPEPSTAGADAHKRPAGEPRAGRHPSASPAGEGDSYGPGGLGITTVGYSDQPEAEAEDANAPHAAFDLERKAPGEVLNAVTGTSQFAANAERSASGFEPMPGLRQPAAQPIRELENVGRFQVMRAFARGGMGKVSIAHDVALGRDVALKELLDPLAGVADGQRRFLAEAEITGQLEHPGVVPIYALGTDEHGKPFYTMRFVEGQTLKQAIDEYQRARRPAELKALVRRFMLVCQTVAYAHERGVIHRDLKPANIMLGRFGETLVMDWGLAKSLGKSLGGGADDATASFHEQPGAATGKKLKTSPADLTAAGSVVGTPAYMPPEQARGRGDEVGAAADIYSLGAVLYHLLTGSPPYTGHSSVEVLEQVKKAPPAKPSSVCRGVPRALEAICLQAMSRQPKGRHATANELARNLEQWLDDEAVDGYAEPLRERLYRWSRKHQSAVVSGAIALAAVLLVGGVGGILYQRERDKASVFERLADDYGRQATEAERRAKEKEAQADRLAGEAQDSRRQANDAIQNEAGARRTAEQAKQQIAEIEAALAAETGETDELSKKIEAARAEAAEAESRVAAESQRADAAVEHAADLERRVAALRREADAYRDEAFKLARLAAEAANPRGPAVVKPNAPWNDFTQQDPRSFEVVSSDNSPGTAAADTERLRSGRQSLRVATRNGGGVCVTYPKSRDANWDLSKYDYLTFAFSIDGADTRYRGDGLAVRMGHGSQSIEYRAQPEALSLMPKGWAFVKIPLWGNAVWVKKEINPLKLSRVDWIELHVSTGSPTVTVWLDDIRFGADPRHQDREMVPDYDRAAAEYIVATHGEAEAWVSGKSVTIRAKGDIPSEPFKIVGVGYPQGAQDVTDVGLKLFGMLTDCRGIYLLDSRITDEGLQHLSKMGSLERFAIEVAAISGSGLSNWRVLQKLSSLSLKYTQVGDDAIADVATVPKLAVLDLTAASVTDDGLRRISAHPTLSSITLWDNARISEDGLRSLKDLPAGLQYLAIDNTAARNGIGFLEGIPLRSIGIKAVLTDGRVERALLESLKLFPDLDTVDIRAARIAENVVSRISELQNITTLTIGSPWNGSAFVDALKYLAPHPRLKTLSIHNVMIEDTRLQGLAALTRLKSLDLYGATVEPAGVLKLQAALPNCKITVSPEIQRAVDALRAGR